MDRELIIKVDSGKDQKEVLNYLKSKGEPTYDGFTVTSIWCYIAFHQGWKQWTLSDLIGSDWIGNKHISKYDFLNNQSPHYEVY